MKLKILNLSNLFILLTIVAAWLITNSVIKPFLHYHFQQTAFNTGIEFFRSFYSYPGGIADYLAEFVAQFFSFNSLGSLLIVAIASLQGFIVLNIVDRFVGKGTFNYTIFSLILILGIVVLCDYRYPYYASIRLLFAFVFTWLFSLINAKYSRLSVVFWLVLAILLFYLANGFVVLVYALSTAFIFILTNKERIWLAVIPVFLFLAGLIPYLGYKYLFQITIRNIYGITMVKPPEQLTYTPGLPVYLYYSLLPAVLLVLLIFLKFPVMVKNSNPIKGKAVEKISLFKKLHVLAFIQVLFCAGCGYFLFFKSYDALKIKLFTIEYDASIGKWAEILKLAKEIDHYDYRVNFQVNRAYSHLGTLPAQLFNYPQLLGVYGLFVNTGMQIGSSDIPVSDLYFDLGFMSESLHWAFEAQTLQPFSPRILKRLVMINLINRKYKLADEFLKVLDRNMLYHDWVDNYKKYVSDTTLCANDLVIAEKRRFTLRKSVVNSGISNSLKLLVETNRNNRMAYDYLLSYYLLDSRLAEFVENLQYYNLYNLTKLPSSWEEALALYMVRTKTIPKFVLPETISKDCIQRFKKFNTIINQYKGDIHAAQNTLAMDFSGTYWYYMLYLSPKVTNALNKKTKVQ